MYESLILIYFLLQCADIATTEYGRDDIIRQTIIYPFKMITVGIFAICFMYIQLTFVLFLINIIHIIAVANNIIQIHRAKKNENQNKT